MRIVITTYTSAKYQPLADLSQPTIRAYCEQHGYFFLPFATHVFPNFSGWDRMRAVMQCLVDPTLQMDVVMWMGADCFITNPRLRIEDALGYNGQQIAAATDLFGLNSDVMIFGNTQRVREFLAATLELQDRTPRNEQEVMEHLMLSPQYRDIVKWETQEVMNAYPYNEASEYNRRGFSGTWWPHAWILQIPALPLNRRIEVAKECLAKL